MRSSGHSQHGCCWYMDSYIYGQGRNLVDFCSTCAPLANSAMMSTLTAHCQWEDETVRERTGQPPSCAEAKKMKSLTLHTHGCARASLRDCSSSSSPPPPPSPPPPSPSSQRRSRLQHGYCIGVSRRSAQATVSKGLAQGPYMAARSGVKPTTLWLRVIDLTNVPPRPTLVCFLFWICVVGCFRSFSRCSSVTSTSTVERREMRVCARMSVEIHS